jgi:hypothetical protein
LKSALKIILGLVWTLFALAVIAVVLVLQPNMLVVAHNLSGAPLNLSLHIRGDGLGPHRLARDGWMLGVLNVRGDADLNIVCQADGAAPVVTEGGYVTSHMQQLAMVDVRRCDQIKDREYSVDGLVYGLLPESR